MMEVRPKKRKTNSILALLLFGVFAVCILFVLLTGADTYRRLTERDQESYDQRTAAQYVATKIRQADREGGISVRIFEGCPALILTEEIDGSIYETRIYHYDGYIRELFAEVGGAYLPEDGEKVMPAGSLLIDEEEPGLQIRILTEDDQWQELRLSLRSGREVIP